ncbi:MAG: hypothetical protein ACR2I0_09700 [Rhodoferax sp.]
MKFADGLRIVGRLVQWLGDGIALIFCGVAVYSLSGNNPNAATALWIAATGVLVALCARGFRWALLRLA